MVRIGVFLNGPESWMRSLLVISSRTHNLFLVKEELQRSPSSTDEKVCCKGRARQR